MKKISLFTAIMKIVGIILLCAALIFTCYGSIMSNAAWGNLTQQISGTGFIDRVNFTTDYFGELAYAASNSDLGKTAKSRKITEDFSGYKTMYLEGLAVKNAEAAAAAVAYFENEFDYESFLDKAEEREEKEQMAEITEIYAYLDALTPPVKVGKNLRDIGTGSSEAYFPGKYEELTAEYGEEAVGEYIDFMRTVESMLIAYTAENPDGVDADANTPKAVAYMDTVFTFEDYTACEVAEKEQAVSYLSNFVDWAESREETGKTVAEFFKDTLAVMQPDYPDATYDLIAVSTQNLITSATYDGSYKALYADMSQSDNGAQFESFLYTFSQGIVDEAETRAAIGAVTLLWGATQYRLIIWAVGLVLLVLGIVLKKTLSAYYMSKQKIDTVEDDDDVLLRVNHLKQYFRSGDFVNKAVDDVSFFIKKGEVFGLVGESGCGKTTTGRTIINLYDPTEGDVYFQGLRISSNMNGMPVLMHQEKIELKARIKALVAEKAKKIKEEPAKKAEITKEYNEKISAERKNFARRCEQIQKSAYESAEEKRRAQQKYRDKRRKELTAQYEAGPKDEEATRRYKTEMELAAKDNMMTKMQMIFQDPVASINPRMTVREIIAEGLRIRNVKDNKYINEKVYEMLELVGLVPEHADRYPHEFSGGQKQRIGIARAIVLEPDLIIADEPISALDVSIQAQVINLLNELRSKMGLTILFIAHNLSVVKYFSDRIAVMYYGHIVEMTTSDELFEHPLHPYTKSLLSAIPYPDPHYEKSRKRIEYNPAQAHDYSKEKPTLREITPGHFIYCNSAELEAYRKELGL